MKTGFFGQTFVMYEDSLGVQRYRPVRYEVRRHLSGVTALWGSTVGAQSFEGLPLLVSGQQTRATTPSTSSRRLDTVL
jgi:hypothetical protein